MPAAELLQGGEDIAGEIATRMAACTVALGAETDIGLKVFRGRRNIDEDQIPCAVLIEGEDRLTSPRPGTRVEVEQEYVLYGYVPCDPNNPNDAAHAVLRDLKRAVFLTDGVPDVRFGGKVRRVQYMGRDIGPRSDGAAFVVAAISISVNYAEDLAEP